MSRLRAGGIAAFFVLMGAWGCGSTTPTPTTPTPTYTQITESYPGTMNAGEQKSFHFAVTNPGSLDAAITALGPVATLTMGLSIGGWDATAETCSKPIFNDAARVNTVISGTPNAAGEYCVTIYDVGNVQSTTEFTITVLHY